MGGERGFPFEGERAQRIAARPQLAGEDASRQVGNGVGQVREFQRHAVDHAALKLDVGLIFLRGGRRFLADVRQARVLDRHLVDQRRRCDGAERLDRGKVRRPDHGQGRGVVAAAQQLQPQQAGGAVAHQHAVDVRQQGLDVVLRLARVVPFGRQAEVFGKERVGGGPESGVVQIGGVLPGEVRVDERVADFVRRVDLRSGYRRLLVVPAVAAEILHEAAQGAELRRKAGDVASVHAQGHDAAVRRAVRAEILLHDAVGELSVVPRGKIEIALQSAGAAVGVAAEQLLRVDVEAAFMHALRRAVEGRAGKRAAGRLRRGFPHGFVAAVALMEIGVPDLSGAFRDGDRERAGQGPAR